MKEKVEGVGGWVEMERADREDRRRRSDEGRGSKYKASLYHPTEYEKNIHTLLYHYIQ